MADNGFSKVIHELRSSLTSVLSLSEILQDYPDITGSKRHEFLEIILQETERMADIIKQAEAPFTAIPITSTPIQTLNVEI